MLRLVMSLLIVGGASAAQAQGRAQLDAVSIHLFLATSGSLSPDVDSIKELLSRNFSVQGEGLADNERFNAALIKVRLTSSREVFAQGVQAEVVIINRGTKRVVKRERIGDIYIGAHGFTYMPVFFPNAACGPFDVVVTGGGRKIVKALEATCGE
jgi:hypothetical protein